MKNTNFEFIDETPLPDYDGKGIYLRHKKTGLEVFHLANNDEENLFAFVVRTPNGSSNGAAHIMEHSVFCGSEKFPLKEPFVNLVNQSLNTFLNAMTYPDKTIYPAASLNKTDYFNLMDVYADAVFFPLLSRETFMQEAHRLEIDAGGKCSIQGVVYNEMKGSYSSFGAVAADYISRSLQTGSVYEFDSGGDPLFIPTLTYEDFIDFHKKFYCPKNVLLFLYGSIPLEEQLDFIQHKFLDRLEKRINSDSADDVANASRFGSVANVAGSANASCDSKSFVDEKFLKQLTPNKIETPVDVRAKGPDSGVQGSYAALNWRLGKTNDLAATMEMIFAMQVLAGHDGSPVSRALLDSGYGDGLITEIDSSFYTASVSFGLTGVKDGSENKIADIVLDVLDDIYTNGTSQENIDAAILAVDFANREVVRSHGPYSLELLARSATGWNYGSHPALMLGYRAAFEKIKEKISGDKSYFQKLVKRLFLDNAARSFVVVSPSGEYTKERAQQEAAMTEKLFSATSAENVKELQENLRAYQYREETSEEAGCIPHISPRDISPERPPIVTEREAFCGTDGSDVLAFFNDEPTNGIAYVDVSFPVDNLEPEEYFYLPLLVSCLFNTGWKGKDWAECLTKSSLCTGDMSASLLNATVSKTERAALAVREAEKFNYIGRDWLVCRMKLPIEKCDEAFSLFADAIACADFTDEARIKNLCDDYYNGALEAVVPGASRFMSSRAACRVNKAHAVTEIWRGMSQVHRLKKITGEGAKKLGERFADIMLRVTASGAIIHVTADGNSISKIKPRLPQFVADAKLRSLSPLTVRDEKAWFDLIALPGLEFDAAVERFKCDTQVGCVSSVVQLNPLSSDEAASFEVLGHWLSANSLWAHIRTAGGAYGAFADVNTRNDYFRFSTYRDPQPERSLQEFEVCVKEACDMNFTVEDVERVVTGTYGDLVQPSSPAGRGTLGLRRILYAVCEEDLLDLRKAVLAVTKKDMKMAAEQICERIKHQQSALLSGKQGEKSENCVDVKDLM